MGRRIIKRLRRVTSKSNGSLNGLQKQQQPQELASDAGKPNSPGLDLSLDLNAYLPGVSPPGSAVSLQHRCIGCEKHCEHECAGSESRSSHAELPFGEIMCLAKVAESEGKQGKIFLNQSALDFLADLDEPFGVISVAGISRTGKSLLLNQIMGAQNGFQIGGSIQPMTQGIWMCVMDKKMLKERGLPDTMTTVFLDTEGIGSFTRTETHDAKIFALATVLSTVLVYNTVGTIDETAIQSLSVASSIATKLQVDALSACPSLVWVLRDFALDMVVGEDNRPLTPEAFLEHVLDKSLSQGTQLLRKTFPSRTCAVLPRPVDDEDELAQLDKVPEANLRDEYKTALATVRQAVHGAITAKSLNGHPLCGLLLCELLNKYVDALNSEQMPNLSHTWGGVLLDQLRVAKEEAVERYTMRFKTRLEEQAGAQQKPEGKDNEESSDTAPLDQTTDAEAQKKDPFFKHLAAILSAHTDALGSAESEYLRGLPPRTLDTETLVRGLAELRQILKHKIMHIQLNEYMGLLKSRDAAVLESLATGLLSVTDTEGLGIAIRDFERRYTNESSGGITAAHAYREARVPLRVLSRCEELAERAIDAARIQAQAEQKGDSEQRSMEMTQILEAVRNELASTKAQWEAAKENLKIEQQSAATMREKAFAMQKEIEEAASSRAAAQAQLEKATAQLGDEESKQSEAQREIAKLQALLEEQQSAAAEARSKQEQEKLQLEAKAAESEKRASAALLSAEEAKTRAEKAEASAGEANSRLEESLALVAAAEQRAAEAERNAAEAAKRVAEAESSAADAKGRTDGAEKRVAEAKSQVEAAERRAEEAEQRAARAEASAKDAVAAAERARTEGDSATREAQQAQHEEAARIAAEQDARAQAAEAEFTRRLYEAEAELKRRLQETEAKAAELAERETVTRDATAAATAAAAAAAEQAAKEAAASAEEKFAKRIDELSAEAKSLQDALEKAQAEARAAEATAEATAEASTKTEAELKEARDALARAEKERDEAIAAAKAAAEEASAAAAKSAEAAKLANAAAATAATEAEAKEEAKPAPAPAATAAAPAPAPAPRRALCRCSIM